MMTLMITLSITLSMIFTVLKHPLSMGLILILQTIIISLTTGMLINTFWFSYILLITMLSGALVLFIYMASIASNEKFYSSSSMWMFITIIMLISITISIMVEINFDIKSMTNINMYNNQVFSLIKLFNMQNMMITIMIISYLFLTMIVISYIVNVFEGPLRTKN